MGHLVQVERREKEGFWAIVVVRERLVPAVRQVHLGFLVRREQAVFLGLRGRPLLLQGLKEHQEPAEHLVVQVRAARQERAEVVVFPVSAGHQVVAVRRVRVARQGHLVLMEHQA